MEKLLSIICWIAWILVIIGALNWGLVGVFNLDLIAIIFGPMTLITRLIYCLVGLSGIYLIYKKFKKISSA